MSLLPQPLWLLELQACATTPVWVCLKYYVCALGKCHLIAQVQIWLLAATQQWWLKTKYYKGMIHDE